MGELREAVLEDLRRRPPKSIEVSEGVGGRDGEGRERGGGWLREWKSVKFVP